MDARRRFRQDVNVFYGDKQAINDVSIDIDREHVTAFIGPSGCGKSTFLRCLNRMNDTIAGARVTGEIVLDGEDIYDLEHGRGAAARPGRHGVPEAQPVPQVDLRECRLWPAHPRPRRRQGRAGRDRRAEPAARRPVGRGQGPPCTKAARPCPAASSSGCASPAPSPSIPR